MKEVHVSNLNELKSVFNGITDNEQYYKILKNSNTHIISNVELASPLIRKINSTIIWKSQSNYNFKSYSNFNDYEKNEIGERVEKFYSVFKNRITQFKGISEDFADKIIQVPDLDSIYYDNTNKYILIINWGFLADSFNRDEGLIKKIFPKPDQSILIKLTNFKNEPIQNESLKLVSDIKTSNSVTDKNGYARFGSLTRGTDFKIFRLHNQNESYLDTFTSEGYKEYSIKIDQSILISLFFKDCNGYFISDLDFDLYVSENPMLNCMTDSEGKFEFPVSIIDNDFSVYLNGKNVLTDNIPSVDSTYTIVIEQDENENIEQKNNEEKLDLQNEEVYSEEITFKFLNWFGNPIKYKKVLLTGSENKPMEKITDKDGKLFFNSNSDSIKYSLDQHKLKWESIIDINEVKNHEIKLIPRYPWLWWFLILILILLLFCCSFFNCFYECDYKKINTNNISEETVKPCYSQNESGGEGITKFTHYLGEQNGVVKIKFDMKNVPDKLEVYYEGILVASTFDIIGNVDGYVGTGLGISCCGELQFNYKKNKEDYCTVVVTGLDGTVWEYFIYCPN